MRPIEQHGKQMTAAMRAATLLVVMLVAIAPGACVMQRSAVAPGGDPMVITEKQIAQVQATTAYDAVSHLHGEFLVSRGRDANNPNLPPVPVHVYVDDTFYGDVATLREIPAMDVAEIRLYQSYEAQYKFGSGHPGGVIQVITKH
jgi:hypothetical protein